MFADFTTSFCKDVNTQVIYRLNPSTNPHITFGGSWVNFSLKIQKTKRTKSVLQKNMVGGLTLSVRLRELPGIAEQNPPRGEQQSSAAEQGPKSEPRRHWVAERWHCRAPGERRTSYRCWDHYLQGGTRTRTPVTTAPTETKGWAGGER